MNRVFLVLLAGLLTACQPDPKAIIEQVIRTHGGSAYQKFAIEFNFRGTHFVLERNRGRFRYQRQLRDSTGVITDLLTNEGFQRLRDGQPTPLSPADSARLANSVNSVAYFALLPFPLSDPAVRSRYLGREDIRGEPYHKIEVRFTAEGGGKDHDDVFIYWFHREKHTLDYLAYSFQVNRGGMRFREAYHPRVVAGIRFQDYRNYRGQGDAAALSEQAALFRKGKLEKVSEIILDSLQAVHP